MGWGMTKDKRRKVRERCKIRVDIWAGGKHTAGYVLDISETGLRLTTDDVLDIWRGDPVELRSLELGFMQGIARWRTPRMIGVELESSTNTLAKFAAYDRFHRQSASRRISAARL